MPDNEITFESITEDELNDYGHRNLVDAIDAASDQGRTTWITDPDGKRIAKIAPVDEIPESAFGRAVSQHEEILAGFDRAYPKLREWRERVAAGTARLAPDRRDDRTLLLGIEARLNTIGQRIGSSARYGEPGIIAQLARMETLQMVTARQVEGIHRVLGLERDEEGQLVADPLGPPLYGKQADTGQLPHDLEYRLDRILTRPDVDVTLCEAVAALVRDAYSRQQSSGRPEDAPDENRMLRPAAPLTVQVVRDALLLAGVQVREEDARTWSNLKAAEAYDWAMRTHLAASDNEITVPLRPSFIPGPERVCISCEQPEGEPHLPTCITRTGTLRLPEGS